MAVATEYNSPEVGFKARSAPSKEMKTADFGEHYRVESEVAIDRQIASEDSEREPSSVMAKEKKKPIIEEVQEIPEAPKPWFRQEYNSNRN